MRFLFIPHDRAQQIIVPTKIVETHKKFHDSVQDFADEFQRTTYNCFLFEYLWAPKREPTSHMLIHFTQYPTMPQTSPPRRYLGPKGVEVRVYFTNDNEAEAKTLLERFLSELPIIERGDGGCEKATPGDIYKWYLRQCEEFEKLETQINQALESVTFKPKRDTSL